jgi:molecular chaperone GrpE
MAKKTDDGSKARNKGREEKRDASAGPDEDAGVQLNISEGGEQSQDEQAAEQKAETAEEVEERLKAEQKDLMAQLLRLRADFENYRKRAQRERKQVEARATEELATELLPVMDHLEMALNAARDHGTDESVVEGFEMVLSQFFGAMQKHGLESIDADKGEFDPSVQEAVAHIPSEDVPENNIVQQTRRGYKLGDKVIRAAEVVVSSGKPEA